MKKRNIIVAVLKWYLKRKVHRFIMWSSIKAGLLLLSPNLVMYLFIALSNESDFSQINRNFDILSYIGVGFILFGFLFPSIIYPVWKETMDTHIYQCQKLNSLFAIYDIDCFKDDMDTTINNCSMSSQQQSQIEDLHDLINQQKFSLKNESLNNLVKNFGEKLEKFDDFCGYNMQPVGTCGFRVPNGGVHTAIRVIHSQGSELKSLYGQIFDAKIKLEEKSWKRFFYKSV